MLRKALKSKTIWFAIVLAVLSVLQGFVVILPIDPQWQALIGVVLAVIVVLLRFSTRRPIDDK